MTQHTAGPWKVDHSHKDRETLIWGHSQEDKGYITIVSEVFVDQCEGGVEEMEANTRLITAAPELLSALLEYTERHEAEGDPKGLPEYEKAMTVIGKIINPI